MKTYQIYTEKQNKEVLIAIKEMLPFAVEVVEFCSLNMIDLRKAKDIFYIDDIYKDNIISIDFSRTNQVETLIINCERSDVHIVSKFPKLDNTTSGYLLIKEKPRLYFYPKQ